MSGKSEESVPVGTRAGEYEVTGLLGRGGMGTVYAGVHPVIGKRVAIKVLDPELAVSASIVERFEREARAVNRIRHRNIIDVFAFGQTPDLGHYCVMPLLEGENLQQRIEGRGTLSPAEIIPILQQIADALDAAHAAGIYHRDLKPENVFLVPEAAGAETVQVLDFGIAKLSADDSVTATRTGMQMGTPLYMSPEQWEGKDIDHRADVYALGVLLFHALTGRYPFESQSRIALMNMHATREPMAPSRYGAPSWIDSPIARALSKEKAERFGSAGELARAFVEQTEAAGAEASAVRTGASESGMGAARTTLRGAAAEIDAVEAPRNPWATFAAVVVLLGAGGVVLALIVGRGAESGEPSGAAAAGADAALAEPSVAAKEIDAGPEAAGSTSGSGATSAEAPAADAAAPLRREPRAVKKPAQRKVRSEADARRRRRPEPRREKAETEPREPDKAPGEPDKVKRPPKEPGWGETVDPYGGE